MYETLKYRSLEKHKENCTLFVRSRTLKALSETALLHYVPCPVGSPHSIHKHKRVFVCAHNVVPAAISARYNTNALVQNDPENDAHSKLLNVHPTAIEYCVQMYSNI